MGAAVSAFSKSYDQELIIKKDMDVMLYISIPLRMYTDSKKLFYSVTKGKHTKRG